MHRAHDHRDCKMVRVGQWKSVRRTLIERECQGNNVDPKQGPCGRLERFFIGQSEAKSHGR